MRELTFRLLCPFGGLGGGAFGFLGAEVRLLGVRARWECMGNIDFDAGACADFEHLTKCKSWNIDINELTAAELRRVHPQAPDCVFLSPPCKGASGLLSAKLAKSPKYRAMNRLAEKWIETMLTAWADDLPRLVLLENVPRLKTRAASMLRKVRALLRRAGYVLHDGFHECGELGGLAQVRRRYLLVARLPSRVPSLLYQPPRKRVRGCGEVLSKLPLPLPGSDAGGPLHRLPKLSWLNWVRLALIPAGGDWRDLEGVLRDGQPRREVFKRHGVQSWEQPAGTVAGSGSNGPSAVADPRIQLGACKPNSHHNKYRVEAWGKPAHTIVGATRPGSGAPSVADLRISTAFDHGYGVLRWGEPSSTVAGGSHPGQGAYSVADLRFGAEYYGGTYGVLSWEQAAATITGRARVDTGRFSVADPRKPPPELPIIIAADGTWHRPLTTLELAALQGLPTEVDGVPLTLHGKSVSAWRERIGNAVPPPAAMAIAEQMLIALVESELGSLALKSTNTPVWVEPVEVLQ